MASSPSREDVVMEVDVLDGNYRHIGKRVELDEAHRGGLRHAAVRLCVVNPRREVLTRFGGTSYAQWHDWKRWNPFVLEGHVAAGEAPLAALLRLLLTEADIRLAPDELERYGFVGLHPQNREHWVDDPRFHKGGYQHRTADYRYMACLPDFPPQRGEINGESARVSYWSPHEILKEHGLFLVADASCYGGGS